MKEQSWDTIIYHVFNHGNHILQNRIGIKLIYISFLSVILSCLIYVICVRLHSFVVSNTYLCYLSNTHCLFFFFHFFFFVLFPISLDCTFFVLPLQYSLTFICIDVIYLFIFTDTRQTEFVFMITVISYFFIIVIEY